MGRRYLDVAAVLDLSSRRPRSSARALRLELASDHLTLREIITRAVEVEMRRKETPSVAALGELLVAMLGDRAAAILGSPSPSDLAGETERALEAFRDGSYRVLVNGRLVIDLDERVSIGVRSQVTFVRVVPLVSG